tara:strand:+ start:142 stop:366 length:225 start_codon:yes stop_codon:yes gene_type:complete
MKQRRKALDIKKKILKLLEEKDYSIRELETKVGTNNITIKTQLKELEFLGLIKLINHKRNDRNGRPYVSARLIR